MKTSLQDLLRQQKESFLNQWFHRILDEYEAKTASFLKGQKDRFANPVAYALREAMEEIFGALMEDRDIDRPTLEYVMKIKAVQESDPAKGIGFIHFLKKIIRDVLAGSVPEKELADFDSRIDGIAGIASEMFINSRKKIAEISSTSNRI
ncbi:MAG: RsbRD N-terminal domain-containing protein [Acidobacteria bacterium]|nr:RsbRD N-terminal domain-containing protein [Acidobacteriota bacterium]